MRRRMLRQLLLLAPIVAVAGTLAGTASAHRGHDHAIAFGRAHFTVSPGQDERIGFVARDRGLRLNDRGIVVYRNVTAGFAYDADLDCVSISGRTARFGYVIPSDPGVPESLRGLGVVVQVVDDGAPGAGTDLVGYVSGPASLAAACATTAVPSMTAIREGNVAVRAGKLDRQKARDDDDTDDTTDDDTDD